MNKNARKLAERITKFASLLALSAFVVLFVVGCGQSSITSPEPEMGSSQKSWSDPGCSGSDASYEEEPLDFGKDRGDVQD
ncbi:MAG: hypothetical protein KJ970_19750 [Candidatus Eisenbacteria bacterium]|uniref:Uncharacterized protein n=1 Tax=Eiseniibacteriota bacterium TaxID=2212470 RepID=A0A948RZA9_UNCEI|nr:hypothetical protein [Candidatus Eisenbacteria bacterium]MBU1947388.1 hypothetical protein [Candidatus Eisenbacteria bacterium]MBU2693156.1 hypothetical protein [Candidatus Eisenbacteria bacterium]